MGQSGWMLATSTRSGTSVRCVGARRAFPLCISGSKLLSTLRKRVRVREEARHRQRRRKRRKPGRSRGRRKRRGR
ncbi:hypothetical protein BHM03_00044233 [Ensete ventricosum]|nr:hypothetical protein BHM03_00044233 [Ensete ventricosum]